MKIKSCLSGIGLWVVALTFTLSPCLVHADCDIIGTIEGGYIVSCTGETGGFCIGAGNDIITVELGAEVSNAVQQFLEAIASANAIAIDAGGGNNHVINYGSIAGTAEANALPEDGSASQATATTTAIKSGDNRDVIENFSTITSTATSNSESGAVSMVPDLSDLFFSATSEATAKGVDAGSDDDQIENTGTINVAAEANANLTDILLPPLGSKTLALPPRATALSTGIEGGTGNDGITNSGTVYATAVSSSESVDISLTLDLEGGATSEATAVGINANEGDDQITNVATINAEAEATASSDAVVLNLLSIGTYATPTTATASSTGIEGGAGKDEITNSGTITAKATSSAEALSVTVSALQYEVASDGDARTESVARATGISGGDEDDKVTNTGAITATTHSTAWTAEITVEGLGASRSNSSTTAEAFSTGINGGIGNDEITNSGTITASAASEANAVGVDLKYISLPLKPAEWFGVDLGNAKTEAQATAVGIEGGEGDDTIINSSTINVSSNAGASSDKIIATLSISSTSESKAPQAFASSVNVEARPAAGAIGVNLPPTASGAEGSEGGDEIFNTGTIAQATASGITGGAGNDSITNNSKIYVKAESEADSLSMSATIAIGKGSVMDLLPDTAIIDAATTAKSTATGIEGGSGNDTITNGDELNAEAIANSTSASIGVLFKDITKFKSAIGIALSDATTKAFSTATGIAGGYGEDTITNSGKIRSTATPDADSASISVTLVGLKEGLAAGVSYADATTTADAKAVGIDGGSGNDIINNSGEIEVTADPTSSSASIGVTLTGAFSQEWSAAIGVAITDGTTKAIAASTGIKGNGGVDAISNSGKITVKGKPDADSTSVSATLTGAQDGLTLGVTYADGTTTAEATAVGIDGGADNDTLTNTSTGQIEVTADPTSSSASVSATITGVTKGTGIVGGAALTDGTTEAISNVAGMKGEDGDDTITNSGKITMKSNPDADSASVSVNLGAAMGELGLVGGFSYADATTTAQATAAGIEGGTGNDTITSTGEIEVTTGPTASSASIGVTAQGVKGMGAAVGISLTDGTTKAISTATGIAGGEGNDAINNLSWITVKALPDADSASVSVSLSAAKEGVAAGGTFADATTTAQATATGIDGGEGNDTITNSGTIGVTADSESSSASVSVSAEGTMTGAALGVALSDGTTKAISNAAGIKGGGGNDTITNYHITTVTSTADIDSASVTVNLGGAETGLVAGVAAADVTTTAESAAIGIGSGSGDDTIENLGLISANATSTISAASVSVNAGVAVNGAAVGAALADGKTVATSSAVGLEGGEGNDTLTNRGLNLVTATSDVTAASVAVDLEGTSAGLSGGVSLVDGENRANASAIGTSGGSGDDTIGNETGGFFPITWVEATTTSTRTNVSVTGTFSVFGAAAGASFADATNNATADARGIEAGEGDDTITNTSILKAVGTTTADTKSVAVSVNLSGGLPSLGASLASAETTGNAYATGIAGGEGNDEIKNMSSGVIAGTSNATAKAKAISVDISTASFSTADATTTASAGSSGITGGSGHDSILNEGIIDLSATSTGDGVAGTGTLTGYGAAKVDVNSWAMTTGMDAGTEDDTIINRNEITTLSNATAKGRSVSVNLLGAVFAEAGTNAHAITNGLSGGAGGDQVTNEGSIDLTATSNADLTAVSVTLLGYSNSDGSSLSEAIAIGIDGGDGENTLTNTSAGSIKATTTAYADTASVSVNLAGAVKADAGSTASATAIGIAGGKEGDSIGNQGKVNLSSTSDTEASATDVTLIGYGDSNAKAISNTTIKGIDGGDGVNTITNSSSGAITGTATALADASSYDIQLSGGGKAKAGTEATATAIGIAGGEDMDAIRNEGTINLTAGSTLVSTSRSYKMFGVGFADADSEAKAIANGIDGGDGANTVTNASTGSITVSSNASATATSMTANIGVAGSSASTTSNAHSTGVKSGDGQDTILNEGNINVTATSITGAAGGDFSLVGLSFGDSLTEATTDGINAGGGNDTIINTGSITVGSVQDNDHPMAYSEVASVSFSLFGISSATFGSKAQAAGIIGGGGDDTILNAGTITVGDDDWMAKGRAYGFSGNFFEFFSLTSVGAMAETFSTGIEGGDGNDTLLNDSSGVLTANATSYASTEGAGDTTTFGSPAAFASSTTKATATGISSGEGEDVIENKGAIDVDAHTLADAYAYTWVGWGEPTSDATANATATASGISAGQGQNLVTISGLITANALAEATPYAKADSDVDTTDAETTSYSKSTAIGIQAGDDGNIVSNTATAAITVTATARTYDAQGNIAKAESDEKATAIAGSVNSPITANAVGVSLGTGDDTVANDGTITVSSLSDARGSAYSNSWPYDAQSDATAYAAANAKGIATGAGANEVINNGEINVSAWSHGNPITDSWSRDQTAIANATADSDAVAIGIEADGNMINTSLGNINVTARATTYADANTNAETTTATANLMATATGIRTASSTGKAVPDRIQNDGTITVNALAGEDGNGNPQTIALADTDVDVRSDRAEAIGSSTVDAAGIRIGDNDAVIINNGNLTVLGRAFAYLSADAFSRDYNPTANAHSNADSSAVGIQAAGGSNAIRNSSLIDVDALAEASAQGRADSWSSRTYTNSYASSIANATGVSVGDGDNIIYNEDSGTIDVNSTARGFSYPTSDEHAKVGTSKDDPGIKASAYATGISAGGGTNQILNDGRIKVRATTSGEGDAFAESDVFDTDTAIWAVVEATATGIASGAGCSQIINNGLMEVIATAISDIYTDSDSNYDADANAGAYAYSNAIGIEASVDNSDKRTDTVITHSGTINVTSTATADGNSRGDSGAGDGNATTYAEASADASGFVVGSTNKLVSIENSGTLEVKSTADTFAYAHGDDNSFAYAKSFGYGYGIRVGDSNELVSINNSGTLKVESTATAHVADDEPTMNSESAADAYGIKIGNNNSDIANSGVLEVKSTAKATIYSDEGPAASTISSAYATGISTGNGTNTIRNDSQLQVTAMAESNPSGGNYNSTNIASAQAIGVKTESGSDTITLGTSGLFNVAANATTFSYNGATNASAIGIDAGDGANQITNHGLVLINADATAEVKREEIGIIGWSITYPATANSSVTAIKSGNEVDIINNYGEIMVNSTASAVINQVLDWSAGTKSATANTIGIDAGNGDNFVANYGSINVSALAAAGTGASPRVRTDGVENTTAIGIKTGDGNDTIINSGKITATNQRLEWVGGWIHIVDWPGIAISSGAGNDQLFLMDGSETNGHIDLGDGDDWLTFTGTPVVQGDITGAFGTDTLVFEGAGSIGFAPVTFENAIKQGAGTYTVPSLPTMQRMEVNRGTLQINSDYAMANDSTFQTNVNGDGSHGQLKVNGTAGLAGDLKVIKGPGPYTNGTTYDIIEAYALNGLFSNVMLPTPTPLLSFEMNQLPNAVEIETSAKNFTTVAKNRVHWTIADYLDRIMPSAKGDLSNVLGEIQSLSEHGEFDTAFSSLSPGSYDNYTRGTLFTAQQYAKSLQYRMNNVRYHFMAGSPDDEKPIVLAYSGSDATIGQLYTPGELSPIQGKNGLWLDAFGQWGDQDEEDGFTGYDYFMRGATLGFDHRVMDKLMAGLSLGYSRSDIDLDRDQGSGDVKNLFGSLYGSYFDRNLYIDAILSYVRNWYDNSRLIRIGGILREARSDHDAHLFSGYLGGGYYFDFNPWAFGPYGSLQYIRLDEESFTEKGAGGVSLRVDDRQTDALVSELGLRMVGHFKGKYGNFLPEVSLGWGHDFDIDDHVVRASFAGSPGSSFSIEGQDVERNGLVAGAGLTFIHKSGISTSFRYKGDFRGDYKSNAIMGELRFSF